MKLKILTLLFSLTLFGCHLNTRMPETLSHDVPIDIKESSIALPISIPVDQIKNLLQQAINENSAQGYLFMQGGISIAPATDLQIILKNSAPVSASAKNDSIELSIPLRADLYVSWKTCSGWPIKICVGHHVDSAPEFTVFVNMKPGLTPDYKFQPNINLTYSLDKPVSFPLGPFTVNLVSQTNNAINKQLTSLQAKLNNELAAKVDARKAAQQAWATATKPISISKENNLWLVGDVTRLYSAPFTTVNNSALINVGIDGKFSAVLGDPPSAQTEGPLPPLAIQAPNPGFVLNLPLTIQYSELENQIRKNTDKLMFDYKGNTIQVKDVKISSTASGELSTGFYVTLKSSGEWLGKSGWLYLVGTPVYDPSSRIVSIKNLSYDTQTQSVLVDTAAWAIEPLVTAKFEEKLAVSIGDYIDATTVKLNAFATSIPIEGIGELNGKLDALDVNAIIVQTKSLTVLTHAKGAMSMNLENVSMQTAVAKK
ncbi:DUF4403 family protein [Pseudomonas sp. XS1P51]